ncbi:MAG: hypothetical protein IKB27_05430 [Clostridia bacterium]|nr:hypothetical protein [Clostridia bacterium]
MFFAAKREEKRKKEKIMELLSKYNAVLIDFQYYYKYFGNLIIVFEYQGQREEFGIDRSEIYRNKKALWLAGYSEGEIKDMFDILINLMTEYFETGDVKKRYKYDWE